MFFQTSQAVLNSQVGPAKTSLEVIRYIVSYIIQPRTCGRSRRAAKGGREEENERTAKKRPDFLLLLHPIQPLFQSGFGSGGPPSSDKRSHLTYKAQNVGCRKDAGHVEKQLGRAGQRDREVEQEQEGVSRNPQPSQSMSAIAQSTQTRDQLTMRSFLIRIFGLGLYVEC